MPSMEYRVGPLDLMTPRLLERQEDSVPFHAIDPQRQGASRGQLSTAPPARRLRMDPEGPNPPTQPFEIPVLLRSEFIY